MSNDEEAKESSETKKIKADLRKLKREVDAKIEKSRIELEQRLKKEAEQKFVTNDRFDELIRYLSANMATKQDFRDLADRLEDMRHDFSRFTTILERIVAPIEDLRLEYAAVVGQMSRQVPWHQEVGEKVSVPWEE